MLLAGLEFGVEVADRDQSDKSALLVGNGEVADPSFAHSGSGFFGCRVGRATDDIRGHDLVDASFLRFTAFGNDTTEHVPLGEDPHDLIVTFDDQGSTAMSIHLDGCLEDGGGDVDFPDGISLLGEELSDLGHELYLREKTEERNERSEPEEDRYLKTGSPQSHLANPLSPEKIVVERRLSRNSLEPKKRESPRPKPRAFLPPSIVFKRPPTDGVNHSAGFVLVLLTLRAGVPFGGVVAEPRVGPACLGFSEAFWETGASFGLATGLVSTTDPAAVSFQESTDQIG